MGNNTYEKGAARGRSPISPLASPRWDRQLGVVGRPARRGKRVARFVHASPYGHFRLGSGAASPKRKRQKIMHRYRTHTCGALTLAEDGADVRLSGWCHRIRDHGGLLFIDLRDHYGMTQCVVDPDSPAFAQAEKLRSECVPVSTARCANARKGPKTRDADGRVEIYVREIEVLGPAGDLPLPVFGDQPYPEDTRLKYRFLDLRREKLHQNIMLRGQVIDLLRRRMKGQGFWSSRRRSSPRLALKARAISSRRRVPSRQIYALPQVAPSCSRLFRQMGLCLRRRQSGSPRRHAQPPRRQGRGSRRNGASRPAGAARLHHHHRGLHLFLPARQNLSEEPQGAGRGRARRKSAASPARNSAMPKIRFWSRCAPARAPRCPA